MNAVLLIVAGAVYVIAVIGVTRIAAGWIARFVPFAREELVYAYTLAATAHQYVSWARAGGQPADVSTEWIGFALFGSMALIGLRWRAVLAAGWLLHALWDYALHPIPATSWVPAWFPDLCVGFDVVLAAYIGMRMRGRFPTRAVLRGATVAVLVLLVLAVSGPVAMAQDHSHHDHHRADAPTPAAPEAASSPRSPFLSAILHHAGSGTSLEPPASPIPMLMGVRGQWMWMVHGQAVMAVIEQNSPGSRDKVFSNNWLMPMVGRPLGPGYFTARAMVSLEPLTSRFASQPEPYQAAHDLVTEIAATYDVMLSRNVLLSFYGAPVGEPALVPTAFMHRLSASDNPVVPVSHMSQDATHQSRDVLTAGVAYKAVRGEVSAFHGRGPDRDRYAIEQGAIDSWSARMSASPGRNWSLQVSRARLTSPNAALPAEDVDRTTASVAYTRPLRRGFWASTVAVGRAGRTRTGP
jgi:hypothetical protein